MMQSLLLWFRSMVLIGLSQPAAAPRFEPHGDGELTARDYEIYYWSSSPAPWY